MHRLFGCDVYPLHLGFGGNRPVYPGHSGPRVASQVAHSNAPCHMSTLRVQSPQHQILAATFDWVKYPVGEGAFSVTSDRAKVGQAVAWRRSRVSSSGKNSIEQQSYLTPVSPVSSLIEGILYRLVKRWSKQVFSMKNTEKPFLHPPSRPLLLIG